MKEFTVIGKVEAYVSVKVTEEDLREYIEFDDIDELDEGQISDVADRIFSGVKGYVGNGGCDKLIGVCNSNESIEVFDNIEWVEVND